eukprot:1185647-Prorocentrum_minimum.AAC.1
MARPRRHRRRTSHMDLRATGSMPLEGSSSSTTRDPPISAIATWCPAAPPATLRSARLPPGVQGCPLGHVSPTRAGGCRGEGRRLPGVLPELHRLT